MKHSKRPSLPPAVVELERLRGEMSKRAWVASIAIDEYPSYRTYMDWCRGQVEKIPSKILERARLVASKRKK